MISFSNFGSNTHEKALKVRARSSSSKTARPDLAVDGEMQADTAVMPEMLDGGLSLGDRASSPTC